MHYRFLFDNDFVLDLIEPNKRNSTLSLREVTVKNGIIGIASTWTTKELALSVGIPYVHVAPDEVKLIHAYMALGATSWEAICAVKPISINNAIAVIHALSQRGKHVINHRDNQRLKQ